MNQRTCWKVILGGTLVFGLPEFFSPSFSYVAQTANRTLITKNSIGPIRLGMTVARIRKVFPGVTLSRTSDGEGVALIAVERRGKTLMTLFAGETDSNSPVNQRAVVEHVSAIDAGYRTSARVHPGMSLRKVEKRYGKLKEIMLSEIESREYATFAGQPGWIQLRVMNDGGMAGIYAEGQTRTKLYSPAAYVLSISISVARNRSHKN